MISTQISQIAGRIREMRQILGISEEEMAKTVGTSVQDYCTAEKGDTDFSFTFIHNCAKTFGVDITELISGDAARLSSFSIVRKGEGMPLERRKGFKYNHLASAFKGRLSEPFIVRAKYDEAAQSRPIPLSKHTGEEFDYILSGSLKVEVDGHTDILGEGDAIYYNSSLPHGMIAAGGADCEFIAIVTDALGHAGDYSSDEIGRETSLPVVRQYNDFVTCTEIDGKLDKIEFHNEENFNFAFDIVDKIASDDPERLAMIYVDKDHNERRFDFAEMSAVSSKAANYLASLGVKKGDRVMLVLKRHWQFWAFLLGCHKLGAIAVPATNQLMAKDFRYRFQSGEINAVVCTPDGLVTSQVDEVISDCPTVKNKIVVNKPVEGWHFFDGEAEAISDKFERTADSAKGNDGMVMFFSSGTTGYPKMVLHSHTYPLGHFITGKYWHCCVEGGLHFTIADTGWGKALWGKIYGQWMCGSAVFVYDFDRFDAHDILPMFAKYNITTFCAPPTMYRFFIRDDLSAYDLSSIRHATVAGEALNPEVYEKFKEATGVLLMEGFGQTETTLTVANLYGMTPKVGSMGKPSPMYDVEIVDSDGNRVRDGETGEICVRTDKGKPCGLFNEYYKDANSTAKAWHDGLYHTGDTAWRDEDGYFWYVGRTDDLIKSSGYRIGPFEIESVIMELPYVLEVAVTAAPDEIRGQVVKATIVLTKDTEGSDELKKEIQNYVKTHTAPYKYPRIVEFVTELPKTISGKIRRVDIRNQDNK